MEQREIKFRAKIKESGIWVDGYYLKLGTSQHYMHRGIHCWEIDPKTLGQYTGLKDKNGKEIYEADIVKHIIESEYLEKEDWSVIVGEVKMINGCWCIGSERYPLFSFENEILGNIYEPHLLENAILSTSKTPEDV